MPSAVDNRPLTWEEFASRIGQTVYLSATPGPYELAQTGGEFVEQVIRPTGLIDPELVVKPVHGQVDDLLAEVRERVDDLLAEAQNLVASAQAKLGRLRRRATADRAEALVARSAAIKRYAEVLRSEGSIPEPGSEPLLAELLPSVADPN